MNYSLGNIISNGGVLRRFNPIAVARINAIYAAGGSCPVGQATATSLLSDFINAEQSSGRWTQHRAIHLPGWGNAAANAIGLVTGQSGTFVNTSAGSFPSGHFVGNDTNQRFVYNQSPAAAGLVAGSASTFMILIERPPSNKPAGLQVAPGMRSIGFSFGGTASGISSYAIGQTATASNVTDTVQAGIYIASETATNNRFCRVRRAGGVTNLQTNTTDFTGTNYSSGAGMNAMAGWNGAYYAHAAAKLGGYGMSLGLSVSDADAYTANLRTLWQGLFQQSLP